MNQKATTMTSYRILTFVVILWLSYLTEAAHIRKHHSKRKAANANSINEYVICRKVLTNHVPKSIQTEISLNYNHKRSKEAAIEVCEPLSFFPIKTTCGKINCDIKRSPKLEETLLPVARSFNDLRPASFFPFARSNINPPAKSHHHGFSDDVLCEHRVREKPVNEAAEIGTYDPVFTMDCPFDGPSIPVSKECVAGTVCVDSKTYENHEKHCQYKVKEVITCTPGDGYIKNKTVLVHNGCECKLVPKSDSIANSWN